MCVHLIKNNLHWLSRHINPFDRKTSVVGGWLFWKFVGQHIATHHHVLSILFAVLHEWTQINRFRNVN